MTSNYHRYIREGLAAVTPKLDEKEAELQGKSIAIVLNILAGIKVVNNYIAAETFREELMKHYRSISALSEKVRKSRQEWSEVHHQIHRSAMNDVQVR